ncbi:unnamed protein product, partial [Arctogadus glacialis]
FKYTKGDPGGLNHSGGGRDPTPTAPPSGPTRNSPSPFRPGLAVHSTVFNLVVFLFGIDLVSLALNLFYFSAVPSSLTVRES